MELSRRNIGDVVQFQKTGKRARVDDVNGIYVYFITELGSRYSTPESSFDAVKVTDPSALKEFENNVSLGLCLNAAKLSAFNKLNNQASSKEDIDDAVIVLNTARKQIKALEARIAQRENPHQPRLSDLIASAEKRLATAPRSFGKEKEDLTR